MSIDLVGSGDVLNCRHIREVGEGRRWKFWATLICPECEWKFVRVWRGTGNLLAYNVVEYRHICRGCGHEFNWSLR